MAGLPDLGPAPVAERWRQADRAGRLGKAAIAILVASLTVHAGLVVLAWLTPPPRIEAAREIPVEIVAEAPKPAEPKPVETKPAESKAAESKPAAPEPPPAAKQEKAEVPKAEPPPTEAAREPAKPAPQAARAESPKAEPPRAEPTKVEPPRPDPAQEQREALSKELDALKAEQAALDAESKEAPKVAPAAKADLAAGPLRDSIQAVALPSAGEEGEVVGYQAVVFSELAKAKERFPRMARAGTVGVRFAVGADGSLARADVAISSGDATLDATALAIVRAAAPFPAPPPGAERDFSANVAYAAPR